MIMKTLLIEKTSNSAKVMEMESVENKKLYLAAVESYCTGTLTPLLKEELKYRIQSRRMSEGKDEMIVEFEQFKKTKQPLRPDEIERQQRRKEQNKRAATKFREKRKMEEKRTKETLKKLIQRNKELNEDMIRLENEKKTLESIIWSQI